MITRPTVLVLGAGASKPYGYPLARELVEDVLHVLKHDESLNMMSDCGTPRSLSERFHDSLASSAASSVDAFLQYRAEFRQAGRQAIALALASYEQHPQDKPITRGPYRWYEYLFAALQCEQDRFADNKLAVVTFNYDRSLEHFLYLSVANCYGIDQETSVRLLSTIPIVHVYGQIGALPWQGHSVDETRAYGHKIGSTASLHLSSKNVLILGEADQGVAGEHACELLDEAERVLFLGFGYNVDNLNVLRMKERTNPPKSAGTAYKLGAATMSRLRSSWPIAVSQPEHDIVAFFQHVTEL